MSATDSGLETSVPTGQPNQAGGVGGDQPNLFNEDALVTKIVDRLIPEIDKRVQSTKDRRFSKFDKDLAALKSSLKDGLVAEGMDPAEVEEELARRLPSTPAKKVVPSSEKVSPGTAPDLADIQRQLLDKLGISAEDPDVVALNQRQLPTGQALAELVALATQRAQPTSPAGIVVPSGSSVRPDLVKSYREEMLAARGKGYNVGREIRDKYRKLGLNVDAISI